MAFHSLEDRIRSLDVEELKRNRLCDAEAEAGLDGRSFGDPYAPYASPGAQTGDESAFVNAFSDPALPLVSNASPFYCTRLPPPIILSIYGSLDASLDS